MSAARWRFLKWAGVLLVALLAVRLLWEFPWRATAAALADAKPRYLIAALIVNLLSLVLKGLGWHLLLRTAAPSRWWVIQEANLIGSAVNDLAIGALGEAARVRFILGRLQVPLQVAVASVFWTRAVEALGFALFILVAPSFQEVHRLVHVLQIVALGLLLLLLGLAWWRRGREPGRWVPRMVRRWLAVVSEIGSPRRLRLPLLLALANWTAQWITFHWTLLATHSMVSYSASFTALVASNLAGFAQLTPGNIGILQTSMALALLPFDVPPEHAVASGLALQAIQVIPVLLLSALLVGWKGLMDLASKQSQATEPVPERDANEKRRRAGS